MVPCFLQQSSPRDALIVGGHSEARAWCRNLEVKRLGRAHGGEGDEQRQIRLHGEAPVVLPGFWVAEPAAGALKKEEVYANSRCGAPPEEGRDSVPERDGQLETMDGDSAIDISTIHREAQQLAGKNELLHLSFLSGCKNKNAPVVAV